MANRSKGPGRAYEGLVQIANGHPQWTGKVQIVWEKITEPLHWKRPRRIFVNSMSDLFHPQVSDEALIMLFTVMGNSHLATPKGTNHTFQILTKRPARQRDFMKRLRWKVGLAVGQLAGENFMLNYMPYLEGLPDPWVSIPGGGPQKPIEQVKGWQPAHIWHGTSVESQEYADERIPLLLDTPSALRFISAEPLLGELNLRRYLSLNQQVFYHDDLLVERVGPALDWVIVGGESGPGARKMEPRWAQYLRDQCTGTKTPFFFKQHGGVRKKDGGYHLSGEVWRQFPAVKNLA